MARVAYRPRRLCGHTLGTLWRRQSRIRMLASRCVGAWPVRVAPNRNGSACLCAASWDKCSTRTVGTRRWRRLCAVFPESIHKSRPLSSTSRAVLPMTSLARNPISNAIRGANASVSPRCRSASAPFHEATRFIDAQLRFTDPSAAAELCGDGLCELALELKRLPFRCPGGGWYGGPCRQCE